jgi:hypothetical protein
MLTSAVMAQDLPEDTKTATLVAINKVMWIQNDLFARHYIPSGSASASGAADSKPVQPTKVALVNDRVWPVLCGSLASALLYCVFKS